MEQTQIYDIRSSVMSCSAHRSYPSIFRDNLPIKSSMVKQSSWTAGSLKMELTGCPETMISNHQSTLRNIPEKQRSQLHRSRSLKSRKHKDTLCK